MYRQALRWAPNIKILRLSDSLNIGNGFWRIIGGLQKLTSLTMYSVSFRGDIPANEVAHVAGLRVLSLNISNSRVFSLLQVLNSTMLSRLNCDPNSLDTLLVGGPVETLETLTISDSEINIQSMHITFSKVPYIRKLTIYSHTEENSTEVVPRSSPTLLPNLQSLKCFFPLLAFLAPGRPLVSLHVLDDDSPPLDLGTILGSHSLLGFPPDIEELKTPGPEATTKLTTLITDAWFPLTDLALQHTILFRILLRTFPALLQFQLDDPVTWKRFSVDEAWRVLVPDKYREEVVAQLKAGDYDMVDHEGYL
ncbi:hypothetical protein BD779DRAFT_1667118 [Infundibulicybe gibba]|nr:hypothetical protein BD779DRAFT_1667118 [Infundibulicybe gibba]